MTSGSLSLSGLQLTNPGETLTLASGFFFVNLGAGGIDLGTASQNLTLEGWLRLTSAQTWNVAQNRVLTVQSNMSGGASTVLSKQGLGTAVLAGNNTFTAPTGVYGGSLLLKDFGTLSDTAGIQVNFATLMLDNTGLVDLADRINDAASLTLRGGTLSHRGRAATASAEILGAVNLATGLSIIAITSGTAAASSADLSFADLGQSSGAMLNFSDPNMGRSRINPRLNVSTLPSLTNNVLPWAVVGGTEFASYIPYTVAGSGAAGGVGALSQSGYAGYSQSLTNTVAGALSSGTSNLRVTAFSGTVPTVTSNLHLNSLNVLAANTDTLAFGRPQPDLRGLFAQW